MNWLGASLREELLGRWEREKEGEGEGEGKWMSWGCDRGRGGG